MYNCLYLAIFSSGEYVDYYDICSHFFQRTTYFLYSETDSSTRYSKQVTVTAKCVCTWTLSLRYRHRSSILVFKLISYKAFRINSQEKSTQKTNKHTTLSLQLHTSEYKNYVEIASILMRI